MAKKVQFIGREKEIAIINKIIGEWGTRRIICITGDGGIGKTRILHEISEQYLNARDENSPLLTTEIIDFDDRVNRNPKSLGRKIANELGVQEFRPYLYALKDWRLMVEAKLSSEKLKEEKIRINGIFLKCLNKVSAEKRLLFFRDTTDVLDNATVFSRMWKKYENCVVLVAGRDAREIGESLQVQLNEDEVIIIDVSPFSEDESLIYIEKKLKILRHNIAPDLKKKLIVVAKGRPILIDLALELIAKNRPLGWLDEQDLDDIVSSTSQELEEYQHDFEYGLVNHIIQTRRNLDWLLLMLTRVYPMDTGMIANLMKISYEDASNLLEDARGYVFIKTLPNGRISLHDEMRRMINKHVWTKVDPKGHRRQNDSQVIAGHLKEASTKLRENIQELQGKEKSVRSSYERKEELDIFMELDALEREQRVIDEQLLEHALLADLEEGVDIFIELFDRAYEVGQYSFNEILLDKVQKHKAKLAPNKLYEIDSRQIKQYLNRGEYQKAKKISIDILNRETTLPIQYVEVSLDLGNAEIRLGNIKSAVGVFANALDISKRDEYFMGKIKTLNALGWSNRLMGYLEKALIYYQQAENLCDQYNVSDKNYGWILNNLTFIYAYFDRQLSREYGDMTIEVWDEIGHREGIGAAYSTLGAVSYQDERYDTALELFQKALDIFRPMQHKEWIGRVLSWRGAVYQDIEKYGLAKADLKESLKVGPKSIRAMTLNRLGRVYMSLGEWGKADKLMEDSYEIAQNIPDYVYWLGSLARRVTIAAITKDIKEIENFRKQFKNCLSKIDYPDGNSLGIAYFAFGRLALLSDDMEQAATDIEKGIVFVTEYGAYAKTDVRKRLSYFEKDLLQKSPKDVREFGKKVQAKITEHIDALPVAEKITYRLVNRKLSQWANWN